MTFRHWLTWMRPSTRFLVELVPIRRLSSIPHREGLRVEEALVLVVLLLR